MKDRRKPPNHLLRQSRLRLPSPSWSGRSMSRQELADAVNAYLAGKDDERYRCEATLDAGYIGKLERGDHRWPNEPRREAFRHVLRVTTDAELGFWIVRGMAWEPPAAARALPSDPAPTTPEASALQPSVTLPIDASRTASTDSEFVTLPIHTAGGIVAYVITRREFLATLARTIPALALPDCSGAPAVPVPGGATDFADPDLQFSTTGEGAAGEQTSFATVTRLLASQRQAVAPEALLSLVEAHRDSLAMLFRRAASDPIRRDIGALLGETSIVASRLWSATGNRSMAIAHCAFARQLSDKLENPILGATARIFESNLHSEAATLLGTQGDVLLGLRMLEEAARVAHLLSPAARARIAAEQAQAYAVLKLERECKEALGRARTEVEDIDDTDRTGLFSDWSPTRLLVYEGTCSLFLGNGSKAVETLRLAVRHSKDDRGNVNVLLAAQVDLASAHAQSGDLDEGCNLLAETFGRLTEIGNHRGIERARRARERLAPWAHERPVQELDERIKQQ